MPSLHFTRCWPDNSESPWKFRTEMGFASALAIAFKDK